MSARVKGQDCDTAAGGEVREKGKHCPLEIGDSGSGRMGVVTRLIPY